MERIFPKRPKIVLDYETFEKKFKKSRVPVVEPYQPTGFPTFCRKTEKRKNLVTQNSVKSRNFKKSQHRDFGKSRGETRAEPGEKPRPVALFSRVRTVPTPPGPGPVLSPNLRRRRQNAFKNVKLHLAVLKILAEAAQIQRFSSSSK